VSFSAYNVSTQKLANIILLFFSVVSSSCVLSYIPLTTLCGFMFHRRPEVDRTCKPFIDHFTSTGEAGLKTVFVPDELVPLFLHCARENSLRSIETCGILCGKLVCITAP